MAEHSRIYIWGAGEYGRKILQAVKTPEYQVFGFVDNDPAKQGQMFEGIKIVSSKEIAGEYDALVIAVMHYEAVLYQLRLEGDTDFSKIIVVFDESHCDNPEYARIIDLQKWKILLLEEKLKKLEKVVKAKFDNLGYEIIDKYSKKMYQYPKIGSTEEAIDKVVREGYSLVRFGDGEFEIMAGKERAVFQKYVPELAKRMLEVISSKEEKLLICIANNYGNIDEYLEDDANSIRFYMDEETRRFHMSVLDKNRTYYDAYMFKTYISYKNREDTWKRVRLIKKIWDNRDVVIVEGDKTRAGYGNDLFDNAKSLQRILCPTQNAFDKYEEILETVLRVEKSRLILAVLGPAAKVLVYDLMRYGYQAVDIGQIDMEYEWYLAGAKERVPIPGKYVSQLPPAEIMDVNDIEYLSQIIGQIKADTD